MKKIIKSLLASTLALSLVACGSTGSNTQVAIDDSSNVLTIGATSIPHAEILEFIKDDLSLEGVELNIKEFSDYTLLNKALVAGDIDANFFQHQPFLDQYILDSGNELVNVVNVHIEPLRLYSKPFTDISEISQGSKVSIPNDATNEGRALLLLQDLGIIKINESAGILCTPNDIIENPLDLEFLEIDAYLLPRALDDSDIAIINTNIALEANIPAEFSLVAESADSPYANAVTVRSNDVDNEKIKVLSEVITSQKVADFINTQYNGAVIPAFSAE